MLSSASRKMHVIAHARREDEMVMGLSEIAQLIGDDAATIAGVDEVGLIDVQG